MTVDYMHMKLLPYKYKVLGEILILVGLLSLLVVVFSFPMDASTSALQLVMSLFILLCYAGIGIIVFTKERVENDAVKTLRFKTLIIVALLYFIAFIILDIYRIWEPGSDWNIYLSVIHTIPFVYYLLFRILYRNLK